MPRSTGQVRTSSNSKPVKTIRPALTPEADEQRMISLAVDLARKQLLDGTASSQVITHYLMLGSSKKKQETEIRELEKELLVAKTEAIRSTKKIEELYEEAIKAMRVYAGSEEPESYDESY